MRRTFTLALVIALNLGLSGLNQPLAAKTYDLGVAESSQMKDAQVVANPAPVIPAEMHEECFKSCCIARFQIDKDGKTKVKLLSSSGSTEIDDITLSTLKQWKFRPATLDGKPIPSTRRIKVEFEID